MSGELVAVAAVLVAPALMLLLILFAATMLVMGLSDAAEAG